MSTICKSNTQINWIFGQWEFTTSTGVTIRMTNAWSTFISALKHLGDSAHSVNDERVSCSDLQIMTDSAKKAMELAEKDISYNLEELENEICVILLNIKELENAIETSGGQINALNGLIEVNKQNIKTTNNQISAAKVTLKTLTEKKETAELKNNVAKGVGIAIAIGATIASTGLAAPVARVCLQAATATTSVIVNIITKQDLDKARNDISVKEKVLKEYKKEIDCNTEKLQKSQNELEKEKQDLQLLNERIIKIRESIKLLTDMKKCVCSTRLYVTVTLGKVEVLSDTRKTHRHRNARQKILLDIADHVSNGIAGNSQLTTTLQPVLLQLQGPVTKQN